MVSGRLTFKDLDYWKEYVPGPSKMETDAAQEWILSRPGVTRMVEHISELIGIDNTWRVLDAGCKEGWTSEYLITEWGFYSENQYAVELSKKQVEYAHSMGRRWVLEGDICCLWALFENRFFDLVLCRHVLGLTRDAFAAMVAMWNVLKVNGCLYVITHVPGNREKHFSYISDKSVVDNWLKDSIFKHHEKIYYGWNPKRNEHQDRKRKELVIFLRKTK